MTNFSAIFDMDGVLIDTVRLHWKAYNELLDELFGVHVEDHELADLIGMSLPEQIPILNEKFTIQIDANTFVPEADRRKELAMDNLSPMEGVVGLLNALSDQGVQTGVGTSTSRVTATQRLKNIGIYEYFSTIVGEEDVTHHKPDPEVYNLVAQNLGADPKECVVFEDAPRGVEAAKNAGMQCIAICTPFVSEEKLGNADLVVCSLAEVTVQKIENIMK